MGEKEKKNEEYIKTIDKYHQEIKNLNNIIIEKSNHIDKLDKDINN